MHMHLLITIKAVKGKTVWDKDIFDCRHIKLYNDNQEVVYFCLFYGQYRNSRESGAVSRRSRGLIRVTPGMGVNLRGDLSACNAQAGSPLYENRKVFMIKNTIKSTSRSLPALMVKARTQK